MKQHYNPAHVSARIHPLSPEYREARKWEMPSTFNLLMNKSYRAGVALVIRDLGPRHVYLYQFRRMAHVAPGAGAHWFRQLTSLCAGTQIALVLHPVHDGLVPYYTSLGCKENTDTILADYTESRYPSNGRKLMVFAPEAEADKPWFFSPRKFVNRIYTELRLS